MTPVVLPNTDSTSETLHLVSEGCSAATSVLSLGSRYYIAVALTDAASRERPSFCTVSKAASENLFYRAGFITLDAIPTISCSTIPEQTWMQDEEEPGCAEIPNFTSYRLVDWWQLQEPGIQTFQASNPVVSDLRETTELVLWRGKDEASVAMFLEQHPSLPALLEEMEPDVACEFGVGTEVVLEQLPPMDPGEHEELVAWVIAHGDIIAGLEKLDRLAEKWDERLWTAGDRRFCLNISFP